MAFRTHFEPEETGVPTPVSFPLLLLQFILRFPLLFSITVFSVSFLLFLFISAFYSAISSGSILIVCRSLFPISYFRLYSANSFRYSIPLDMGTLESWI